MSALKALLLIDQSLDVPKLPLWG